MELAMLRKFERRACMPTSHNIFKNYLIFCQFMGPDSSYIDQIGKLDICTHGRHIPAEHQIIEKYLYRSIASGISHIDDFGKLGVWSHDTSHSNQT